MKGKKISFLIFTLIFVFIAALAFAKNEKTKWVKGWQVTTWEDNMYGTKHISLVKYQNNTSGPTLSIQIAAVENDSNPRLVFTFGFPNKYVGSSMYENKAIIKLDDMEPIEYTAFCSASSGSVFNDTNLLLKMLDHKKIIVRLSGYNSHDSSFDISKLKEVIEPYKLIYYEELFRDDTNK